MLKGKKRSSKEYDEEVEKAIKRFKKHKESLRSARDSERWLEFLDNLGIDMLSGARTDFFERVRVGIVEISKPRQVTRSELERLYEQGISVEDNKLYKDPETGRYTSEAEGNIPIPIYRDTKGRFVSVKKVLKWE